LFKEDLLRQLRDIKDAIFPKADLTEVRNIEHKIFEELAKVVENLYKKFADRIDTKQNFKILER
jgi:alpha-beta hydrolase superfamily lysophospholipase